MELQASIVAVTVHPGRARITRRGGATLPAGPSELVVADLPGTLLDESVRVSGRGAGVRIVGVDVRHRDLTEVPDDRVRAAETALRDAERAVAAVDATDAGTAARQELLTRLADRSGAKLAAALADGTAQLPRVTEIGEAVATEVADVVAARRTNTERRTEAERGVDAARAELDRLRTSGRSRREAVVGVEADADGELELELTYLVDGAAWSTAYDARLDDAGSVALTWYGMVTQASGEDWPACELTLSTARPAAASTLPELDPWWVDVAPPPVPVMMAGRARSLPADAMATAPAAPMAKALEAAPVAQPENAVSASWRLPRPTAVPGDATPHRVIVTTMELAARLDHVTAPAVSTDAYLRAVANNRSGQVLLAGPVATFVADAFVGTTVIEQTAPGADLELALGIDDRVVVERELASRTARKARFGANRSAVEQWTITVANRRPRPARVTVRDRLPVTRNADIKIVDVVLEPEPAERDDLGRVEWTATIDPDATWEASVRFGVEHPKDLSLTGWH